MYPTVRDIIEDFLRCLPENVGPLQLPLTYEGYPVDFSSLDQPIKGYVIEGKTMEKQS